MDLQKKKRLQFLIFAIGIVALSITAEKCRQMVGEEASSKSGQFTFLNCLDMSSGTVACGVKEGIKLYTNNIRSAHVEKAREIAFHAAFQDALSQGLTSQNAAKVADLEGAKAVKLATRKAKRIVGPIISSGWDFFEAIYYGGTLTEGFLRGTGTLLGTYYIGFHGERTLGRFGYLVGSQLGSWVGGRVGLMVYDIINGAHFLLQFAQSGASEIYENLETVASDESEAFETSEYPVSEDSNVESNAFETPEYPVSEDSNVESNAFETPEYPVSEDSERL